jgi:UMF1 family MFS transporter
MDDPAVGSTLWAYATGGAELIAAILAPVLGAIADAGLSRKPWIAGFSVLFVLGLSGLWLAIPGRTDLVPLVLVSFGLATIGAELATVFNNAMMSSLVSPKRLGTLSGVGWATGYVGGLVSLFLVLALVIPAAGSGQTLLGLPPLIPLDPATREADRLVGPFSGLWYLLFVLPLFLFTPDRPATASRPEPVKMVLKQLARGAQDIVRNHRQIALFLLARMLYADGLGAIFAFGGIYAATVFGWGVTELGVFGIVLTIAGTVGAALGGVFDDQVGSKRVIVWTLVLFIVAAIAVLSVDADHIFFVLAVAPKRAGSALFASTGEQVYLLFAVLIGLASGPIQSSSRTLLARLAPPDKTTEFFGFFSFSGKASAFAAPLLIGVVTAATGSQRLGIASSLVFLIGGLLLLMRVKARS